MFSFISFFLADENLLPAWFKKGNPRLYSNPYLKWCMFYSTPIFKA